MTVIIEGRELTLSPRRAVDVLNLSAAAMKDQEDDSTMRLLRMARVVSDSLRATYLDLGRIRGFRYRPYTDRDGVQRLIELLSIDQISEAVERVAELEGLKKKVTPPREESA